MKMIYDYPSPLLNGQWHARFIFIAGRLCVDFTLTGGHSPERAGWERLNSPNDLSDWLAICPLHLKDVAVTRSEFDLALELREAIWSLLHSVIQHTSPDPRALELVNRIAALPDLSPALTADGQDYLWLSPGQASQALATIARDTVDLLSGDLRERIRECENPNCQLVFVDQSRPGKRRWCLMERCGNLHKTRAYRSRKQSKLPEEEHRL
jgi:predicted RNA-binding Zn ribbon-like protein